MRETNTIFSAIVISSVITAVLTGVAIWVMFEAQENAPSTQEPPVITYEGREHLPNGAEVVTYDGTSFTPEQVEIKSGETIVFRNQSDGLMYVHADPSESHGDIPGFDPAHRVNPGEAQVYTFTGSGKITYHDHENHEAVGIIFILD